MVDVHHLHVGLFCSAGIPIMSYYHEVGYLTLQMAVNLIDRIDY